MAISTKLPGARESDMENICESLIKIVTGNKLKVLSGLNQNGKGYGSCSCLLGMTQPRIPPVERRLLSRSLVYFAKLGKPV